MLKELLDEKGALSRQIGQAKKAGEPIDALLDQMKAVSKKIKSLQAEEKQKKAEQSVSSSIETGKADGTSDKARLFSTIEARSEASVSRIEHLTEGATSDTKDAWNDYVANHPNASIYHRLAFKSVIEKSFGHRCIYLMAFDESGALIGVLPSVEMQSPLFGHFLTSNPFFTYGGALADNLEIEDALFQHLIAYCKDVGAGHIEYRAQSARPSEKFSYPCKEHKVSMVRSLPPSSEQLWSDIGTKVRAQIKKADRFGFQCKFGGGEILDDYYQVFAENMRDLGTPVYSKQFFKDLIESEIKQCFTLGVVYYQGKPIACCFLMANGEIMEIPWASALNAYNHMNVNMFMYWQILKLSVEKGAGFFDFGRSSKDASTYRFKKQWGAEPQQLYWYYWLPEGESLPELNPNNPKYRLLIAVWQRLPVWLAKIIGPPVVKYLP